MTAQQAAERQARHECMQKELVEALQNVLDTREAEAKAWLSLEVAQENFSSAREEVKAWKHAANAASAAEIAAHALLARAKEQQ